MDRIVIRKDTYVDSVFLMALSAELGKTPALEAGHVVLATPVLAALRAEPGDRPFFLFISWIEPHHQNDLNRFVAPEGYAARYANPWVPEDLIGRPGDWYSQLPDYYGAIARIDECLGDLSPRQRMIFLLKHDQQHTIREIAAELHCTEGSVKTHCSRAVHALAAALQAKGVSL